MALPAKSIQCSASGITPIANLQSTGLSSAVPYRWTVTLAVTAQNHSSTATRAARVYNGLDVAVGDYVARTTTGQAVKIIAIASATTSSVTCTVEDENQYNALRDPSLAGAGIFSSGACVIFSLNPLGIPVVDPVPTTVTSPTFITNLKSRFESSQTAPSAGGSSVTKVATIGALPSTPSTGDMVYVTDKGDGTWGLYVWNGSSWDAFSTAESATVEAKTVSFTITSASADGTTTINTAKLANNGVVTAVSVRVNTPFNDPAATLTLGVTGNTAAFLAANECDINASGLFTSMPYYVNTSGNDQTLTYSLSKAAASAGSLVVTLTFS